MDVPDPEFALAVLEARIRHLEAENAKLRGPFTCGHPPEYAAGACAACHAQAIDALGTILQASSGSSDPLVMSLHSIAQRGIKARE